MNRMEVIMPQGTNIKITREKKNSKYSFPHFVRQNSVEDLVEDGFDYNKVTNLFGFGDIRDKAAYAYPYTVDYLRKNYPSLYNKDKLVYITLPETETIYISDINWAEYCIEQGKISI